VTGGVVPGRQAGQAAPKDGRSVVVKRQPNVGAATARRLRMSSPAAGANPTDQVVEALLQFGDGEVAAI
jgi:hypothetical protein